MGDFLEIDGVEEKDLPAHLRDGKQGDRVSLVEGGLLHVRGGRATFVPSGDVLGVLEHEGCAYVLVPRRPPSQPWVEVLPSMLDREHRGIQGFLTRLEERGGTSGGYRDAVRTRRQNLSTHALREKIMQRAAVPGALEVPSTIMLGVSYPGLNLVQGLILLGVGGLAYVSMIVFSVVGALMTSPDAQPIFSLLSYPIFIGGIILGGWLAMTVGKRWKERVNRTLPRQRVLVLAPDGCIVGFSSGVRTLAWSEVGRFEIGPSSHGNGLIVVDQHQRQLGDVDAGWLDAPLGLVVGVAEAYRSAARDE
jgi:hypothetical protein